ncbi:MAG: hypothetical protein AB2672_01515 [Candidatus Thiodiazotropha endolucinida]|nr:hypothetical protein [Candidatus Thiodiazotropha sp. (ex Lucina pensylvanica)]MCG7875297.1 hypothetical protein [Candidatus Thiodiazotropha taylori]MCG8023279.1 hypothetical protein [Candidatus Thiodiazotropha endolucinida]MCG7884372.1 hypothetical protein [Candidatus Thiodiazotropha taylori]MCG7887669.1 hypothetical protein [Candidatus Thiodiazotropha taylori]
MKWLFFILLLANLGMFILIYPQQAEKNVENGLPDVGELFLFKEIEVLKTEPSVADDVVLADVNSPAADQVQDSSGDRTETPEADDLSSEERTPTEPIAEPQPEFPIAGAETPAEPEFEMPDSDNAVAEMPAPEVIPVCRTIGYLESRSDAEIASVSLRALGLKPELQSETSNEQAGVWVLIPPQATRREAIEISNRLERDGVSDLWRFTSGELVHAISLGLFRNEERAKARKNEIIDLGYEAIIKPRYRQKTKYWLYFQEGTPTSDSKKGWNDLFAKFPDLEAKETECR